MRNILGIVFVILISISIIFLSSITEIDITYANHTKYHINNSLVDVTISGNNIPDWIFEGIHSSIINNMNTKEVNSFSNSNNKSYLQIEVTQYEGANKDVMEEASLILTSQKYIENEDSNYDDLVGQVKNTGNELAESVKIIFTFYDNNNDIVGTDYTFLETELLNPGQKAPFSLMVDKREIQGVVNYEIALSWYNSDGIEEYLEDIKVTKDPKEKTPLIEDLEEDSKDETLPFFSVENDDKDDKDKDDDKDDKDKDDD